MSGFRIKRCGVAVLGIALLVALISALPSLAQPQAASAQGYITCPNGQTFPSSYGYQYCSTTTTTVATGYPYCGNSSYNSNQYCCPVGTSGYANYNYPNYNYPGQGCSTSGYTQCSNGQYVMNGQTCSVSYTCPNGQVVYNYSSCSTTTTPYQYCGYPNTNNQYCCPGSSSYNCNYPGNGYNTVTYQAGWNIIGVPSGTSLVGASGPLYTYRQGDNAYEVIPVGSSLQSGWGYWAYFPTSTTVTLATASTTSVSVSLPPGQFVMVGNPGNGVATVNGANVGLFTYTPNGGYQQATSLNPGQGAWAISLTGGTITISSSGGSLPPPPPF